MTTSQDSAGKTEQRRASGSSSILQKYGKYGSQQKTKVRQIDGLRENSDDDDDRDLGSQGTRQQVMKSVQEGLSRQFDINQSARETKVFKIVNKHKVDINDFRTNYEKMKSELLDQENNQIVVIKSKRLYYDEEMVNSFKRFRTKQSNDLKSFDRVFKSQFQDCYADIDSALTKHQAEQMYLFSAFQGQTSLKRQDCIDKMMTRIDKCKESIHSEFNAYKKQQDLNLKSLDDKVRSWREQDKHQHDELQANTLDQFRAYDDKMMMFNKLIDKLQKEAASNEANDSE